MPAHFGHRRRGGVEIGADKVAPLLGVQLSRNFGRAHKVTEQHREIAAFAGGFDRGRGRWWRNRGLDRRWYDGRRQGCRSRCTAQFGDRFQQLLAMAERGDADVLEIVVRLNFETKNEVTA
jgi:hypothetical protein